jgi:hypothetical protein
MTQLMDAQPVAVDDASLATLERLHEDIRNGYEPFMPKFYSAPGDELWEATQLCLRLARELVFESGSARVDQEAWEPL